MTQVQSDADGPALATEPRSELAAERVIDGPAGPLRIRVLRCGEVRAGYVYLHGGGWARGAADRHDQTLLRFAHAAGWPRTASARSVRAG